MLYTKTKAQIIDVAKCFDLKIKTSANKETCVTFIEQKLQQNPSLLRNALSYNELKALYILFKDVQDPHAGRGRGSAPSAGFDSVSSDSAGSDSANARLPEEDACYEFSMEDLEGLLLIGLLGISFDRKTDAPIFYLPNNMKEYLLPELQTCFQDQALKKAYHIENLFLGMLTLYGALPIRKIEELFNNYLPEALPLPDLLHYFQSNRLGRKYNAAYSDKHLMFFYHTCIPDVKSLLAEIEQRKNLKYATFTESELLQASERVYYYKNTFSQQLLRHLNKFDIPDTEI